MITTLIGKDGMVADLEMKYEAIQAQMDEYTRTQRRSGVNIDYLKGIIVQFLSKPVGSSERAALLPVFATLLQFGPEDYAAIEAGYSDQSTLGGLLGGLFGGGASSGVKVIGENRNAAGRAAPPPAAQAAAGRAWGGETGTGNVSPKPAARAESAEQKEGEAGEFVGAAAAKAATMTASAVSSGPSVGEIKVAGITKAAAAPQESARKKRTSMQF
jgi:hypothetical protein